MLYVIKSFDVSRELCEIGNEGVGWPEGRPYLDAADGALRLYEMDDLSCGGLYKRYFSMAPCRLMQNTGEEQFMLEPCREEDDQKLMLVILPEMPERTYGFKDADLVGSVPAKWSDGRCERPGYLLFRFESETGYVFIIVGGKKAVIYSWTSCVFGWSRDDICTFTEDPGASFAKYDRVSNDVERYKRMNEIVNRFKSVVENCDLHGVPFRKSDLFVFYPGFVRMRLNADGLDMVDFEYNEDELAKFEGCIEALSDLCRVAISPIISAYFIRCDEQQRGRPFGEA